MREFKNFMECCGNVLYNNMVQTPFSIVKGLALLHGLPSHINLLWKMKKEGLVRRVHSVVPSYTINKEFVSSQSDKEKLLEDHYYSKILNLGIDLIKGESKPELVATFAPQFFLTFFSGFYVAGSYINAVKSYGTKALIPLAVTTGLSLAHEIKFNKKLKNLEGHLEEK